jgi:2'-5' RNA ligase
MTLRFLPRAVPAQVASALDQAALAQADVSLGPSVVSFSDRVVVIPATGLDDLAAAVLDTTAHLGSVDPRPFNGHLTLARTKNGAKCSLLGEPFVASFMATTIELVASEGGNIGSHHRTLRSWQLVEPDD